jgi:putative transposase
MSGMSYVSSYFHCVFSTKARRPLISAPLRDRLRLFLEGIARQNQMTAIEVGGMPDHVHILLSLPSTLCPTPSFPKVTTRPTPPGCTVMNAA